MKQMNDQNTAVNPCAYIKAKFTDKSLALRLKDGYLASIGAAQRKDMPMIIEQPTGVLYLRDDAVDDLLNTIDCMKKDIDEKIYKTYTLTNDVHTLQAKVDQLNKKINDMRVQLLFARGNR
jgi:hypothetical protein